MTTFLWILFGGILMSAIALVGSVTLILRESTLQKLLLPLVAFAAGSLIGGALFHMIPAALASMPTMATLYWVAVGFSIFLALEQFLHWHHCHRAFAECRKPLTYLILIGDGLHNFLGGLAIAGVFLVDVRLGVAAWLAAAAHEVPRSSATSACSSTEAGRSARRSCSTSCPAWPSWSAVWSPMPRRDSSTCTGWSRSRRATSFTSAPRTWCAHQRVL